MRLFKSLAVLVALVALSGCAVIARTDVTAFHTLPPTGSAETFTIEAPPGKDAASLEFQDYAGQVTARLSAYGWRAAPPDVTTPTYRVVIDYGVSPPEYQERLEPFYPGPYPYYGGYRRFGYWPYAGPVGYAPVVDRYFARTLEMKVYWTVRGNERGPLVYEGRAVNRGRSDAITPVVPILVSALFSNFPGASGRTVTIEQQIQ